MALVQKSFSDIITFSRSSNATRVGPNGLVQYAPHNLILQSQTIDNASWTKSAATVTANATAAPDGTVTADNHVPDTTTTGHNIYQACSVTSGVIYTLSVYAKAAGYNYLALYAGAFSQGKFFDLANGLVLGDLISSPTSAAIQSVGNGWYRCSITFLATSTTSSAFSVYPSTTGSNYIFAGNGTSGIFIWGAQLAVGPLALDYTPTTSAAVYGPRFDYDPVTLAARGLLVEEQRTNIVTYSEQFDNAYWLSGGTATVTANATTAPDGTVTADLVIPTAASAFHRLSSPDLGQTTVAYSVFVKAGGYSKVALRENATQGSYISVNLNTGTIIESANVGTGTVSGATITSFGNGWYRISGYFVTPINSAWGLVILPDSYTSGNVTTAWTGNGTSGVYVWGAQAEVASFASSYIPTLASTVTRSADVASVNTLSPWFSATEGSLYAEVVYSSVAPSFPLACSLDNNTTSYISLSKDTTNSTSFTALVVDGGATQANMSTANAVAANSVVKGAVGYKANDFGFSVNGNTAVTDTSGTVPTVTKLSIGSQSSFNATNGWIRRIAYYPRKLSSAELQALTA